MSDYGLYEAQKKLDVDAYIKKISEAVGKPVTLSFTHKSDNDIFVEVKDESNRPKAFFQMIQFPGCCAFCISTGTNINRSWQGKKISYILQEIKADLARSAGYAGIFATIVKGHPAQEKVLPKSGYTLVTEASGRVNPKTHNNISTYFKGLN